MSDFSDVLVTQLPEDELQEEMGIQGTNPSNIANIQNVIQQEYAAMGLELPEEIERQVDQGTQTQQQNPLSAFFVQCYHGLVLLHLV